MGAEPITELQLVTQWLQYVVENEQELLEKYTRSERRRLYNSFVKSIDAHGDKVSRIHLRFYKYLRYLDMGVGRGVASGSRFVNKNFYKKRNRLGQLHKYKRKKIPVYNKPITAETKRLLELLADNFNIKAITTLENMMQKNEITITL